MSYTVNVSTSNTNVITTVTEALITITPDGDQPVTIVDSTVVVESTSELSTTTIYSNAIELLVDDFANYFKGDWVSGTVYRRGELVNSLYSLYVCNTGTNTTITSTVAPAQDTLNWRRVVWKEAPFASLTVTTTATVEDLIVNRNFVMGTGVGSGLVINSTATFNGPAIFNSTASFNQDVDFNQLSVDTLRVAGLYYPSNKGLYGQVLTTNGENTSSWVNLGDLVFWSLSNDLYTNGYDIISNSPTARLVMGSAVTGTPENVFKQAIIFEPNNSYDNDAPDQALNSDFGLSEINHISIYNLQDNGQIKVKADRTRIYGQDSLEIGLDRYAAFGDPQFTVMRMNEDGTIFRNNVTFDDAVDVTGTLDVSTIRFNDGSTQSTAPGALTTATASVLGGIKVGNYLTINPSTGVLSINIDTLGPALPETYTLPVATASVLGGIKIGSGLQINAGNGVASVPTATTATQGIVRVGSGLTIDVDGILSATGGGGGGGGGIEILEDGVTQKTTATNINFTGGLVNVDATTNGVDVDIDLNLGLRDWASGSTYGVGYHIYYIGSLWTRIKSGAGSDGGEPGNVNSDWIKVGQLGTTTTQGVYTVGHGFNLSDTSNKNILNLNTATSTLLGGIKIGQGLSIDPDTGLVNVSNTASITDLVNDLYINDYAIKYKTGETGALTYSTATNQTGAEIIAARLESDANTGLTLRENNTLLQSNSNQLRFQKFASGSSLQLSNTDSGSLSMTNTNVTLTAVNTLTLTGGTAITITAPAMLIDVDDITVDAINVDITSNNFTVYAATRFTGAVDFEAETTIGNTTTELTLRGTNILAQSSGYTRIGSNNTSSNLHVRAIYNYDGTFAPFFPAGVQYQDQTVQRTAWRGYDQGLI